NRIVVNDKNIFADTKTYIQRIAPEKADIVAYYNNGSPIFDSFGITKQVKAAFGKTVNLPSGAYLILEPTEALHVIDVNSGYKSVGNNQEQNAIETNLEAAEEIARQLRLRDLGGIVVVDFIDMELPDSKRRVLEALEAALAKDRARTKIVGLSDLGLVQLTRKRTRRGIAAALTRTCPACAGLGRIKNAPTIASEALFEIRRL